MHPLIQTLVGSGPVVTDGAWGTELQARGLPPGAFPDAWNLTNPEAVLEVARAYVDAGSRIILTNTFGANRIRLAMDGLAADASEINRIGVVISKRAAFGRALVFASVGPTGLLLLDGAADATEMRAAYEEQAAALAEAGADGLVVETMCDLDEAVIAVSAAKRTRLPVVACMVFDSGQNGDCTIMGNTPGDSVLRLAEAGADVIGANCGQGIERFVEICRTLRNATSLPVWIKANAGIPEMIEGKARYAATPTSFAAHVPDLLNAGANFIGGCCGTNPEFIRSVCATIQAHRAHC